MSLGSVVVADDGTVTKSGLVGAFYDAISAQELPLIPDPATKPAEYPGSIGEWSAYINVVLVRVKRLWGRQATAAATGNGISSYAAHAANTTIGVAAYADLLSTAFTSKQASGFLLVQFTASGVHLTNQGTTYFQIVVNGAPVKGCYTTASIGFAFSATIMCRVAVTAGTHTVAVQWKTDSASARINALGTNEEHAHLFVQEVG